MQIASDRGAGRGREGVWGVGVGVGGGDGSVNLFSFVTELYPMGMFS